MKLEASSKGCLFKRKGWGAHVKIQKGCSSNFLGFEILRILFCEGGVINWFYFFCLNSYCTFLIFPTFNFLKICCFLHWIQSVNPHFFVTLIIMDLPIFMRLCKATATALKNFSPVHSIKFQKLCFHCKENLQYGYTNTWCNGKIC